MKSKPTALLVENDPLEEMLARRAIRQSSLKCDIRVVPDHASACRILFACADPAPSIVLVNFNIPKREGSEVAPRRPGRVDANTLAVIVYDASLKADELPRRRQSWPRPKAARFTYSTPYQKRLHSVVSDWISVN